MVTPHRVLFGGRIDSHIDNLHATTFKIFECGDNAFFENVRRDRVEMLKQAIQDICIKVGLVRTFVFIRQDGITNGARNGLVVCQLRNVFRDRMRGKLYVKIAKDNFVCKGSGQWKFLCLDFYIYLGD